MEFNMTQLASIRTVGFVFGLCLLTGSAIAEDAPAASVPAAAPASPVTANLGLFTQYIFRGISQTDKKPALQGGFDYAHESGFYVGVWGSNISWISDAAPAVSASIELDLYGGYKKTIGDFSYDIGYLRYQYPGSYPAGFVKPHTDELYAQGGWKFFTLKYSHSLGDTFGIADAKNSYYLDLTGTVPLNDQISLSAHIGRQKFDGASNGVSNNFYSYTDYKVEGTYALGKEWALGAGYTNSNARRDAYTNVHGTFLGDGMGYAFARKTF
jgi:uncharacterized protein (TIGR02001 family)